MKHGAVEENGVSFKENGDFHLGKKLALGPREVNLRLGEESLFCF